MLEGHRGSSHLFYIVHQVSGLQKLLLVKLSSRSRHHIPNGPETFFGQARLDEQLKALLALHAHTSSVTPLVQPCLQSRKPSGVHETQLDPMAADGLDASSSHL